MAMIRGRCLLLRLTRIEMLTSNYWLDQDMHLFTNGCDYVIATSMEEAREIAMTTMYGYHGPYEELDWMEKEEVDYEGWMQFPDDDDFTFTHEDGSKETAIASDWVKVIGKGYFASTEL